MFRPVTWAVTIVAATTFGVLSLTGGAADAFVPQMDAIEARVSPLDGGGVGGATITTNNETVARRALEVHGEYDAVTVVDAADLNPRETISIEAWVKHQHPRGCGTVVGKDRDVSYWFGLCEGRPRFYTSFGAYAEGNSVVPEGRWTHLAVTYDGVSVRFYVGGELDRESTDASQPLELSEADLRIGADQTSGLVLHGTIDHVRLWSIVRTREQLRDNAFRALSAQAGLVAQWPLDGSTRDLAGGHDGSIASGGSFTYDGAVPRDIGVPLVDGVPNIDGRCEATEYGGAQRVSVDAPDAPTIWIQATQRDVYVCFDRMDRLRNQNGLTYIYLDRDLSRHAVANDRDYRLGISQRGLVEADQGDGGGGWRDVDLPGGVWQVAHTQDTDEWTAEYRVPRSFLDRPTEQGEPVRFGLSLAHSSDVPATAEYLWPVGALHASPLTWSAASIAMSPGLSPLASFTGTVVRGSDDASREGLAGAVLRLIAVDEDELARVVDWTVTGRGGGYDLSFWGEPPQEFLVQEVDPRGVTSVSADAGPSAEVSGANLLRYVVNDDGEVTGNDWPGYFVDEVADITPPPLNVRYLIVYAAPVQESDLWPVVVARERQGFDVTAMSTEEVMRQVDGRDLAEKIHNWLKATWEAADDEGEAVFALLVGRGDKVPIRDVGWMDNDHREVGQPDYYPAWPTDWYYADLDSDWDSDGDGFYGEFMRCPPGETYEGEDGETDCPEEGSLMREGPFGELRSSEDDYLPEISVGRLAINEPGEVRRALEVAVAAEGVSGTEKRRALVEGSFWTFEGSSWDDNADWYVPGGHSQSDAWLGMPWRGQSPLGDDTAEHLDVTLKPMLERTMSDVIRFYESTVPYDIPEYASPTSRDPDKPLTPLASENEWESGSRALVNIAGRGGPDGVVGARWAYDWNNDFRINQPADPRNCRGMPVGPGQEGPPCWELLVEPFVHGMMPEPEGVPPVVIANASQTGAVAWSVGGLDEDGSVLDLTYGPPALAGQLPSHKKAAAWVGAMGDIAPKLLDTFQDETNSYLLEQPMRVGDAVWAANSQLAREDPYDMRVYGVGLFGDPAMSYWGNTVDANAAWPQDGRDLSGSGSTPLTGPAVPELVWDTNEHRPASSVSIGDDGSLVAVGQNGVINYAPNGQVLAQTALQGIGGMTQWPAALAVDSVYVASASTLYVLDRDLGVREQVRLPAGASATGAPRIAPDGAVWVPSSGGMVRASGSGRAERVSNDPAVGAMTVMPNGAIVWPIDGGAIATFEVDRMGDWDVNEIDVPTFGSITAAAVDADSKLYVGSTDGRLYALDGDRLLWQVDLGGAVRSRPALSADGTVYAAGENGVVVSVDSGGTENWRHEIGDSVQGSLTVDGSQLYVPAGTMLRVLELASGSELWRIDTSGVTDLRSVPVIGPDRTVYLNVSSSNIVAVRETGWLPNPTHVSVSTATDRATIDWIDNADDEVSYVVELCGTDGRCTMVGEVGPDTTRLTVRRLPFAAAEPFFARVRADGYAGPPPGAANAALLGATDDSALSVVANHSSNYGRSDWVVSLPTEPEAAVGLEAEGVGAASIKLTWSYGADAGQLLGFEIRRGSDPFGPFLPVAMAGAADRAYVDTMLQPNTEYFYQVFSVNEAGTARPASADATTMLLKIPKPADLSARYQRDAFLLHWRDTTAAETGYVVERRGPGEAWFKVVGVLDANTEWFLDSLYVDAGAYDYRVKAVNDTSESEYVTLGTRTMAGDLSEVFLPFAIR